MESLKKFKSIEEYPGVILFRPEDLAKYDDYIRKAFERSKKMELAAREWASKNIIQFHTGR